MGWEKRARGGFYYTRSHKVNGRVIREYVGKGPRAELAASTDAMKRLQREEEAKVWRLERDNLETVDQALAELCEAVEVVSRATLLAAGFRQHKRGQWRRKRGSK